MRNFIARHRDAYGVEPLCKVLQVAPSAYRRHAALQRAPHKRCARAIPAFQRDAAPERRWVVQHALRSAVKRGEPGALAALGFGALAEVTIGQASMTPHHAVVGGTLNIAFDVTNATALPQSVLVDFAVHYVKANGQSRAKVFKLKTLDLAAHETQRVGEIHFSGRDDHAQTPPRLASRGCNPQRACRSTRCL